MTEDQILALFPQLLPYIGYITAAVTIANIISTMLHAPKPNASKAYQWFYWGVHQCAMLRGNATPLSSPAATGIVGGLGAIQNPRISTSSVPVQSEMGQALVANIQANLATAANPSPPLVPTSTFGDKQ